MVMKLAALKRIFHPVWDVPEEDVEVRFLAPGVGGKWGMEIGDTCYDVANKLWTINLKITGPTGEKNDPPPEGAPVTHVDKSSESSIPRGAAGPKHTHDGTATGVPVADEPSDT